MIEEKTCSTIKAANFLNISVEWVRELCRDGILQGAIKPDNGEGNQFRWDIPVQSVLDYDINRKPGRGRPRRVKKINDRLRIS